MLVCQSITECPTPVVPSSIAAGAWKCHHVSLQGADPFARNDHEQTPLYVAVEAKQTKAVQLLCQTCPCTVNNADEWGLCPLHIAARAGNVDAVTLLLLAQVMLLLACIIWWVCLYLP